MGFMQAYVYSGNTTSTQRRTQEIHPCRNYTINYNTSDLLMPSVNF